MSDKIMVTRSSMPTLEEYEEEIKDIFETRWLTNMGVKHQELEKELCEKLKVKNISLFNNGHLALYTAIHKMNLTGEVITTPFTFASTTHAIVQNGLKPVFCDINEEDYTIDVDKIEEKITPKTTAIVTVHVYGHACDVKRIEEIAKKHNLKVIYDAAHVFGVEIDGKGIGSFGDVSMFSFHATKVFNTIEGGALVYNDSSLKSEFDSYKNFGIIDQEHVIDVGINSKMNEFQAAMGLCNLRHLDEEIEKRRKVYEIYTKRLQNVEGIKISKTQKNVKPNFAYYPVVFDKEKFGKSRDEIAEKLAKENIFARKYFYPITSAFDCYKGQFDVNETPIAKKISENVLTIPMYAGLSEEDANRICDIILNK